MSNAQLWWLLAGVLVAVELATGTFYLLMLALGVAVGAVVAMLGLPPHWQIFMGALSGMALTALWHWRRARRPPALPAAQNRDVNLDIGQTVQVDAWSADGTARVQYRGTQWPAHAAPGEILRAGSHRIVAVEGNWLVLSATAPR